MTIADEENEVQKNVVSSLNQNSKFCVFTGTVIHVEGNISRGI